MNHLLDSLDSAIRTQNWSAGLALALMIPDAFAKIAYPEMNGGGQVGARYARWFQEFVQPYAYNVPPNYPALLDGQICYALRCAYLHSATTELDARQVRDRVSNIRFTYSPGIHCNQFNGMLVLDISTFCRDLLQGGQRFAVNRPFPFADLELVLQPDTTGSISLHVPGMGVIQLSSGEK